MTLMSTEKNNSLCIFFIQHMYILLKPLFSAIFFRIIFLRFFRLHPFTFKLQLKKGKNMIDNPLTFIITVMVLSITPGPCMTLALNSGLTVGIKRTQFLGLGDYFGLLIYTTLSGIGIGALLAESPTIFSLSQYIGAGYLLYLGYKSVTSTFTDTNGTNIQKNISSSILFKQGFVTLLSNPKAILFYGAFFPQFLNVEKPLFDQLIIMIPIIIIAEFISINVYAIGGKALRHFLRDNGGKTINRISGILLICVGAWLGLK